MTTWKDLKIGVKLSLGFGVMILLMGGASYVGYNGIHTVAKDMYIIADEEAPIKDSAMEMQIALVESVIAMDQFVAATSVIGTDDESVLEGIEKSYQKSLGHFDLYVDAILEGGEPKDGHVVIKTEDKELAEKIIAAAELHNSKFRVVANELMSVGREQLKLKAERDAAMEGFEKSYEKISEESKSLNMTTGIE